MSIKNENKNIHRKNNKNPKKSQFKKKSREFNKKKWWNIKHQESMQ